MNIAFVVILIVIVVVFLLILCCLPPKQAEAVKKFLVTIGTLLVGGLFLYKYFGYIVWAFVALIAIYAISKMDIQNLTVAQNVSYTNTAHAYQN